MRGSSGPTKRNTVVRWIVGIIILIAIVAVSYDYLRTANIPVLEPAGPIAQQEKNLIVFAFALSLIVIIPVFWMLFYFAWRYREDRGSTYRPEFDSSRVIESLWWGIPTIIIAILGVVAWRSSHQLDPFKPIVSSAQPITIDVVALDWKWLFIYPQQNIASVNLVEFPVNTPVVFNITSDAPMNSFWIPQLSGQIYAMPGMNTQLNVLASKVGSYNGWSANISGSGFAGMTFTAKAVPSSNFDSWLKIVLNSNRTLNSNSYASLAKPSSNDPVSYYSYADPSLFEGVIMKYMMPSSSMGSMQ